MSKPYEEIAPRLRALRDAVDMSVQDMAQKTGMSVEEIENYESGLHEIPVSFLFDVAKVCGVDTTVLISGGDSHLKGFTVVRGEGGLDVRRRKDYGYKSLAYRFAGRKMEPFIVTVPPKESEEMNFNHHSGQEFIYMLRGKLEIRLEDKVTVLEPSDSIYFDSHIPHALRGLDGKEAEFLDVII